MRPTTTWAKAAPGSNEVRRQAFCVVRRTELTFDTAAPTVQVLLGIRTAGVKRIDGDLLPEALRNDRRWGQARLRISQPQVAEGIATPTEELAEGAQPAARILTGHDVFPVPGTSPETATHGLSLPHAAGSARAGCAASAHNSGGQMTSFTQRRP